MPVEPRRQSKAEVVYRQVRGDIEAGVYKPGEQLGEVMLVERLGASRTPVREALRRLAADGLVDFTPRLGATVSRISLQSARELFEYRQILETAAIKRVAQQVPAEPGVAGAFHDLLSGFERVAEQPASAERTTHFYELTESFDATIAHAAGNQYLSRAIAELRPHTVRLRQVSHTAPERMQASLGEHAAMCAAVLAGDPERSAELLRAHLEASMSTIFQSLLATGRTPIDLA